jgi:tRNA-Thr(GGU) m(6)t(6)A37 methyltransferase TsaA
VYRFDPIGSIHSGFPQKFGIPRQAGLAPEARAVLELYAPYGRAEALAGLEAFSHIWVVFVFHANLERPWHPTVRPPRLGGNRRIGLFATRSAFRPNPVGISAVRLAGIRQAGDRAELDLAGGDFLDGTPVLDIKPYLPYADRIEKAGGGFAAAAPPMLPVDFEAGAEESCRRIEAAGHAGLRRLIVQVLANDPRPAYDARSDSAGSYGLRLGGHEVRWAVRGGRVRVLSVAATQSEAKPPGSDPTPDFKSRP